ncbi:MAG: hypothetical protein KAR06_09460, partial [Deltaproteobacteria bacterium]|nr:hypothetical protein [Deltaproteobacteria bacterium]
YWEMRFDTLADKNVWKLPDKIERAVHLDNDRLLSSTLTGQALSFTTNKTIFTSIINLHKVDHWHKMMDMLSGRSKWALHKEDKERFYGYAHDRVLDVLKHGEKARCVKADPTGKKNLTLAVTKRKKLTNLKKQGRDWEEELESDLDLFSVRAK